MHRARALGLMGGDGMGGDGTVGDGMVDDGMFDDGMVGDDRADAEDAPATDTAGSGGAADGAQRASAGVERGADIPVRDHAAVTDDHELRLALPSRACPEVVRVTDGTGLGPGLVRPGLESCVGAAAPATMCTMSDDPQLRILVLMRHAEAKSHSADGDLGRELSAAGRRVAQEVGLWLRRQGVRPQVVVVSPSVRTRQTWEGLREAGVGADEVWSDEALYDTDPEDIVESIQAVPDDVGTLVVIGHAPGVPALAAELEQRLPAHADSPDRGWPPAGVAVVGHRGSWTTFPSPESAVVAFRRP